VNYESFFPAALDTVSKSCTETIMECINSNDSEQNMSMKIWVIITQIFWTI